MNHPASPRSVVAAGAPVLALLLYCGLAFYQLPLPGFYYDEALDAWFSRAPAMRGEAT